MSVSDVGHSIQCEASSVNGIGHIPQSLELRSPLGMQGLDWLFTRDDAVYTNEVGHMCHHMGLHIHFLVGEEVGHGCHISLVLHHVLGEETISLGLSVPYILPAQLKERGSRLPLGLFCLLFLIELDVINECRHYPILESSHLPVEHRRDGVIVVHDQNGLQLVSLNSLQRCSFRPHLKVVCSSHFGSLERHERTTVVIFNAV
ncbi:hypothetical protein PENTCL1PPCAC_6190 [Pristionchus entomophagus]|uniref:Uncharacterized protein n=1 Tax=Pristionchus entomophagus TaxID=358040 RepID=A0AAV5SVC2_9BILA|nr:hypothetical protein PENTCL1PPCAC_6190 [Pristionchus entomophagus]